MNDKQLTSWLSDHDKLARAMAFAARRHLGQRYPGGNTPYIAHPSSVAMMTGDLCRHYRGYNRFLAMNIAVLHDVSEDCGVSFDELRTEFGVRIASGVFALSKDPKLPRYRQMPDSLLRIKRESKEVWLVKIADRIFNLRLILDAKPRQRIAWDVGYLVESELILNELGSIGGIAPRLLRARIEACRRRLALRPGP